jgi:hypothetical protein
MIRFFVFCITICFSFLFAKEEYYLLGEAKFSSYTGAEDILTFHESLECLLSKTNKFNKRNVICFLARSLEMTAIWMPLSEAEMVLEHEVFGHGYRLRDINHGMVGNIHYGIGWPYPYGNGGGVTFYDFNPNLTSFSEIAISLAGVDSTAILANRLKMKWATDLRLDPKKAFLYIDSFHDLTSYVYSLDNSAIFKDDGHDIESYLYWLNNTYYSKSLTKDDLKRAALVNLFDPTTYYCLYSILNYLITGKDMTFSMIKINNFRFLPNLRLGLAPYGIEYYLENYMSYKNYPIYSYLRAGNFSGNTYWGLGLEYPNVYKFNNNKIGFRFDFFRQPKIYLNGGDFIFHDISIGFTKDELQTMINGLSAYLIYERKLFKKSDISLHVEIGYKTQGFVPSEDLRDSYIARIGLGFCSF